MNEPQVPFPNLFAQLSEREQKGILRHLRDPARRTAGPNGEVPRSKAVRDFKVGVSMGWWLWLSPSILLLCFFAGAGLTGELGPSSVMSGVLFSIAALLVARFFLRMRQVRRMLYEYDGQAWGGPQAAKASSRRRGLRLLPIWSWLTILLIGLYFFARYADQVYELRAWPSERAELVRNTATQAVSPKQCGDPASDGRDMTWRSEDPPTGLPATFTVTNVCQLTDNAPGRTYTIVRDLSAGSPEVVVDPVRSYGRALASAAAAAVLAWIGFTVVFALRLIWRRRAKQ